MESTASIAAALESVVTIEYPIAALSQTLHNYLSQQPVYDCGSLRDLLAEVNAVTGALNQLVGILDDELENVKNSKPRLLSDKAVEFIKERADQSLVVFWRIDQQLRKRRELRDFEESLVEKLVGFNEQVKEKKYRLERLDSMGLLIRLESRKWVDVAPKIDGFSKQLRKLQLNLALVFQVISIRARSQTPQWPLKSEEVRMLNKIYSKATATAARVDLSSISEKLEGVQHTRGGRRTRERFYEDRIRPRRRDYSSSRSRSSSRSLSPIPPPTDHRHHPGSRAKVDEPIVVDTVELPMSLNSQSLVDPKVEADKENAQPETSLDEKRSDLKDNDSVGATSDLPAYEKCQSEKPQKKLVSEAVSKVADVVSSSVSKPYINLDGQTKFGSPSLLGRMKSIFQSSRPTPPPKPAGDNESHLLAYVIKNETRFQIPIAKDTAITEPQEREIDWWKTFAFLSDRELQVLEKLMLPEGGVDLLKGTWSKSVVHLERMEEPSIKFWTPNNSALLVVIYAKLQKDTKNELGNTYQFRPHADIPSSAPVVAPTDDIYGPPPPPPPPGMKGPAGPGPFARPPPPPSFKPPVISTKIFDIGPRPIMDTKACLDVLTSFSMFTIHKAPHGPHGAPATWEPSWERVAAVEEKISPEQIKKQIKKLNAGWRKSVTEKKVELEHAQQDQISKLLDQLQTSEIDPNFALTLEQLDTRYKRMKLATIIVYIKRCPNWWLNPIEIHQNIERNKAALKLARQTTQSALMNNQSCRPQPPPFGGGDGAAAPFMPVKVEPTGPGAYMPLAPKMKPLLRSYRSSSSVTTYDSESTYYSSSDRDTIIMMGRRSNRNQRYRDGSDNDEVDVIQELLSLWTVPPTGETSDDGSKGKNTDTEGSTERALAGSPSDVDLVTTLEKARETKARIGSPSYVDLVTALSKSEKSPSKEEAGEQSPVEDAEIANQKESHDITAGRDDKRAETQLPWLDREYAQKVVGATKLPSKRSRRSRYPRGRYSDSSDSGW